MDKATKDVTTSIMGIPDSNNVQQSINSYVIFYTSTVKTKIILITLACKIRLGTKLI